MEYINLFGLSFMGVFMVPNIIFAIRNKDSFENIYHNKSLETVEEIGRYGCFVFMIFMESGMLNIFGSGRQEEKLILLISGLAVAIMVLLSGSFLLLWGKKMR